MPPQYDVGGCLAVLGGHLDDVRVTENLVPSLGSAGGDGARQSPGSVSGAQRGVGLEGNLVDPAVISEVLLVEVGVALILQDRGLVLLGVDHDFFDLLPITHHTQHSPSTRRHFTC